MRSLFLTAAVAIGTIVGMGGATQKAEAWHWGHWGGYYGHSHFYGPRWSSYSYRYAPSWPAYSYYGPRWGSYYTPYYYPRSYYYSAPVYYSSPIYYSSPAYYSPPVYYTASVPVARTYNGGAVQYVRQATTTRLVDVEAYSNYFQPQTLRITAGTRVRWINYSGRTHTVTPRDGQWGSADLLSGESYAKTFDEPGTYRYYCRHHDGMEGTIVVVGNGGNGARSDY